ELEKMAVKEGLQYTDLIAEHRSATIINETFSQGATAINKSSCQGATVIDEHS
ncbi:hypothetical protein E4U52_004225, partial [Claviceps spartinae]